MPLSKEDIAALAAKPTLTADEIRQLSETLYAGLATGGTQEAWALAEAAEKALGEHGYNGSGKLAPAIIPSTIIVPQPAKVAPAQPAKPKEVKRRKPPVAPITSLDDERLRNVAPDVMDILRKGHGAENNPGFYDQKVMGELKRLTFPIDQIKQIWRCSALGKDVAQWPRSFDDELNRLYGNTESDDRPAIEGGWPDGVSKGGAPIAGIRNTIAALQGLGLACRLDTFRRVQFVVGTLAGEAFNGEISDAVVTMARVAIPEKYRFCPPKEMVQEALIYLGRSNKHNPVVAYLNSLKWDGTQRLDNVLHTYLGAEDSEYVRAISRKTLCALVRRAKHPGSTFQHVLTLDGPQDIGKTFFCKDLAGAEALYVDSAVIAQSAKEAMEIMGGKWVIEIGEMAGFNNTAREKVKAFITRESDRARMAYERFAVDQPRACIFIATKNPGNILNDPTGERRWWVVDVTKYDRDAFRRDRDQILAEAVAREPDEKLWLDSESLRAAHVAHVATKKKDDALVDVLAGLRGKVVDAEERVSNERVRAFLGLKPDDTLRMKDIGTRIAEAMMSLGWEKVPALRMPDADKPCRGYRRAARGADAGDDDGVPF